MHCTQGRAALLLLASFVCAPAALAADTPAAKKPPADPTADAVMMSGGFLSAHPDLRFRLHGQEEYKRQAYGEAFRYFQRAAWYGDKPSQGMVAEMLWNAQGVAQDRALAYAWMDLAAERGYEGFTILRERYWLALDEAERQRAIEVGQDVYGKYGDAAAEPRLAAVLRRERAKQTGSRTGFTGSLKILVPGPGGDMQIDGSKYYDDRYWEPAQYRAWQDSVWKKPRTGRVDVGEVEQVQLDAESRIPVTPPQADAQEPQTPEPDDTRLERQPGH